MKVAPSRSRVFLSVAFAGAGALALLLDTGPSMAGKRRAVVALSFLSITFGLWLFWTHGGRRITAAGIWGLTNAVLLGGGALWALSATPNWPRADLLLALSIAYFGEILTYALFWSRRPERLSGRLKIDPGVARWGTMWGIIIILISTTLALQTGDAATLGLITASSGLQFLFSAGAFSGVVLLAASLLLGGGKGYSPWRFALIGFAFAVYALILFSGGGRLNLVALALCLVVFASRRFQARVIKSVVVVASVPTLLILGFIRNPDPTTGLGSAFIPLPNFGRLLVLSQAGRLPLAWGSTFWTSVVGLVPRSIFPTKPIGFGAVLVPYLSPQNLGTNHSDAALFQGEWLFNFGLLGLLIMIPFVGWFVGRIDRWLTVLNSHPVLERRHLMALVAATILATGLVDLAWVGSFTFVVRSGASLATIGVLYLITRQPIKRPSRARSLSPRWSTSNLSLSHER
jgi:hypothetical protein